ncbi:MAG TPA: hypothetical protein VGS01_13330 [Candidatus Limnocylindria bacterium]|jgi:hypothetical protein|nr:hypothetical protein [Candidatus Limnocylindria bacterium]
MANAPAPEVDRERLTAVVAGALCRPIDALGEWTLAPIGYAAFNPVSQGLYRVAGSARSGGEDLSWSVVLKICRAPREEDFANIALDDREKLREVLRWDREADAYASGLLDTLPPGLAAPRCFGVDRHDDSAWLWMEYVVDETVAWDTARYALAARHLGRFNGMYLAGRPTPDYPWLSRNWLRDWVAYFTRTGGALLADDRVWAQPLAAELFPPTARADLRRLLAEYDRWWRALDALPLVLSHLDAFRANILSRAGRHGVETVAIDWSFVGHAPLGAEVAHLVIASLFYHGDTGDPAELTSECLRGYAEGLRDSGCDVPTDLRRAFVINAVARWGFIFGPLGAVGDVAKEDAIARRRGVPFRDVLALIAAKTSYLCELSREVDVS